MAVIRRRATTIAYKQETTPGVDAFGGSPPAAATDFLRADITVTFNQQVIPNPELTGTLDDAASIAGGTKVQIELNCMLKGSGTAGVAPQWGGLMALCGFQPTVTAAAIGAPTAATAGTTGSVTLATPFAATAELYRGMPITLSGNPATPITTTIADYTVGRLATLDYLFGTALSTSTLAIIPPNVLYSPISDPTQIKSGTVVIFMDGIQWKFTGCVGTFVANLPTAQPGTIKFTLTGQYTAPVAASAPTGIVFDAVQPPVFRAGMCRLNGALARTSTVTFDAGNTLFEPENPEAIEGFDPSVITLRSPKGSFDPLMSVTDTIARVAAFKIGAAQSASVILGGNAGNQIAFTAPSVQYTGYTPTNRSDVMAETVPFECNGPNSSLFLAVF